MVAVKPASTPAEQRTTLTRPGVVETVMPSRILLSQLRATFGEVERLGSGPIWFVDLAATSSFETACVPFAGSALGALKKKGLRRLVAVIPSPAVRMAARAVSLASGVEIRIVERRLEALPLLSPDTL